jgi:hypothetical protein
MNAKAPHDADKQLNDWLCGQVARCDSIEALFAVASDRREFKLDPMEAAITTAKSWCKWQQSASLKVHGSYISDFERHLLMCMDSKGGAMAAMLLMELRRRWQLDDSFPITTTASERILPGLTRHLCENARDLLIEAGMIRQRRRFTLCHDGHHLCALYALAPVREDGSLPELRKKTKAMKKTLKRENDMDVPKHVWDAWVRGGLVSPDDTTEAMTAEDKAYIEETNRTRVQLDLPPLTPSEIAYFLGRNAEPL